MSDLELIELFCEERNDDFIQMGLIWSSLSYIFVAGLLTRPWLCRKDTQIVSFQTLFILLSCAIGISSFFFHILKNTWSYFLHTAPIIILVIAYISVALHDYVGFKPMLSFIVSLSAGSVVVSFTYATPKFAFFPVPILMVLIAAGAYFNNGSKTAAYLILCAALLSVAIVFRWLDLPLCDRFPFGLHSIWHLLSAITIYCLITIHRIHPMERDKESSVSSSL